MKEDTEIHHPPYLFIFTMLLTLRHMFPLSPHVSITKLSGKLWLNWQYFSFLLIPNKTMS